MLDRTIFPLRWALLSSAAAHFGLLCVLALGVPAGHGSRDSESRGANTPRVAVKLASQHQPASTSAERDVQVAQRITSPIATVASAPAKHALPPAIASVVPIGNLSIRAAPNSDVPLSPDETAELPIDLSTVPGHYYFASSEVDRAARPLGEIEPALPEGTEAQAGYLLMRVLIDERGEVDQIEMLISEPAGVFDSTVVAAFSAARFEPAVREGLPVKSQKIVELKIDTEPRAALVFGNSVILYQSERGELIRAATSPTPSVAETRHSP